jgi:lipopolysaccharide transport system permease protein
MLATGCGLIASSLMVRYRDVQYVLPIATQLLLYTSPVAYSLSAVPSSARRFVLANPLSGLLEEFRISLLGKGHVSLLVLTWSSVACVGLLVIGAYVFSSMERDFADVI